MDILAQAKTLSQQGKTIYHLEIGEPDFATAEPIVNAGIDTLKQYKTHYTSALGLPELRESIAAYYDRKFSLDINPRRIIITPGASGALQLAILCLLDAGDNVLLADPGYPCNRHIASLFNADVQAVAVNQETDYQLSAELVESNWQENTRVVLIASPSNPTGTLIPTQQLSEIYQLVQAKGAQLIVDEIYHGLVYEGRAKSILEIIKTALIAGDDVLVYGFGKFSVKIKAERKGRNPSTGKDLVIPARRIVTFKCSRLLRERVNGG